MALSEERGQLDAIEDTRVSFVRQPKALPATRRMSFRLAVLVLVLSRFRNNSASLSSAHLFLWSLRSTRTRQMLLSWWSGARSAGSATSRLDSQLPITLNVAVANGLVAVKSSTGRISLTNAGLELASAINEQPELMLAEKQYLSRFLRLSDAEITRRLGVFV